MTATYNPAESERLIESLRLMAMDERTPRVWRSPLTSAADQLDAARGEIRRLEQRDAFAERADEHKSRVIADLSAEIDQLTAPLAIDDFFAGRFEVFLASRDPDSWQARGPQRQSVDEAEQDRDAANDAQHLVADLARLRSDLVERDASIVQLVAQRDEYQRQADQQRSRIAELEGELRVRDDRQQDQIR